MRKVCPLVSIVLLAVIGCGIATQSSQATEVSRAPRIRDAVLEGTWVSAQGDRLEFGKGQCQASLDGKEREGAYHLEAYALMLEGQRVGYIGLNSADELRLNLSREQFVVFKREP